MTRTCCFQLLKLLPNFRRFGCDYLILRKFASGARGPRAFSSLFSLSLVSQALLVWVHCFEVQLFWSPDGQTSGSRPGPMGSARRALQQGTWKYLKTKNSDGASNCGTTLAGWCRQVMTSQEVRSTLCMSTHCTPRCHCLFRIRDVGKARSRRFFRHFTQFLI